MSVIPNFLGIGAQKAGTTWLYEQLNQHPDIYMPGARKEIHYFDRYYKKGLSWYLSFFAPEAATYTAIGEITPEYLLSESAPLRIKNDIGNPKFIVMLRDPVERLFSHYRMFYSSGRAFSSVKAFAQEHKDALARGFYKQQLENYFYHFSRQNFLILIYEEIFKDDDSRLEALQQIASFLGVDENKFDPLQSSKRSGAYLSSGRPKFYPAFRIAHNIRNWLMDKDMEGVVRWAKRLGVSKKLFGPSTKPPEMTTNEREWLAKQYQKDIRELENLIARPLDMWSAPHNQS